MNIFGAGNDDKTVQGAKIADNNQLDSFQVRLLLCDGRSQC